MVKLTSSHPSQYILCSSSWHSSDYGNYGIFFVNNEYPLGKKYIHAYTYTYTHVCNIHIRTHTHICMYIYTFRNTNMFLIKYRESSASPSNYFYCFLQHGSLQPKAIEQRDFSCISLFALLTRSLRLKPAATLERKCGMPRLHISILFLCLLGLEILPVIPQQYNTLPGQGTKSAYTHSSRAHHHTGRVEPLTPR